VAEIVQALASNGLESVIIVGQLEKDRRPIRLPHFDGLKTFDWPSFLRFDDSSVGNIDFWKDTANAPVKILYSSGECKNFQKRPTVGLIAFWTGVRKFYFNHLLDISLHCLGRLLENQSASYITVSLWAVYRFWRPTDINNSGRPLAF
jgi:hypothetical protein